MIAVNGHSPRECAAGYLAAGLSVLPIRGDGTKAPAMSGGWKQYQTTPLTLADVPRFWLADNVGVGIVHGAVSGGTEAIDIDTEDLFGPYVREVERLAPGLLDRLTMIKTPRPGYHLVYRCDTIEGSQKLAQYPDPENPKKPKTLIETRGEGGYTVAPGSPGCCHETGGVYQHVDGPPLTELSTITPEERDILFRVARSFNEIHEETPTTASKPQGERVDGLSPGDDFNRRATWEQILEPHGWEHSHDKYWRRPGKTNGWSATIGCKSQAGTELFCCFSDNAHPLTGANGRSPCTAYSKFALYAALNHGGDYSAAARRLRTEGYGDAPRERVSDGGDRWSTEPPSDSQQQPEEVDTPGMFDEWARAVINRERPEIFRWAPSGSPLSELRIGPGMVTLIGAQPGAGKTVLTGQIVLDALRTEGQEHLRTLNGNVEMSPGVLLNRFLARVTGVAHRFIRDRNYDDDAAWRIEEGIEILRPLMPRIEFMAPPFTLERLTTRAEASHSDIVVVDYAQRFDVAAGSKDQRMQASVVMERSRRIADQGRAVIVVSALNRGGYQGAAGLGSFRESSELEYGADAAYLLTRDDKDRPNDTTLLCVKNRHGELGKTDLKFDGDRMQFTAVNLEDFVWTP